MKIEKSSLPGLLIIKPKIFTDKRGYLFEIWNLNLYKKHGIKAKIVQVICVNSKKNTLRGIHFQYPHMQGKFVTIINGKIFDVIVDIRKNSPTYGKWCGLTLDSKEKKQLWIPEGFGHAYLVLSKTATIIYTCTQKYYPKNQKSIIWNDPYINIRWPIKKPILSKKDTKGLKLNEIKELPKWRK